MAERPSVLCFGEVLWDCLPHGRFVGGAPLNVAYHLTKLGSPAWPVTSVGDDELGRELLDRIRDAGIATDLVGIRPDRPTGVVNVTLDKGSPSYDIVEDVAWDYIDIPDPLPAACKPVGAMVFGSLAQRSEHNRHALRELLDRAASTLKVLDVNRRPPFDAPTLIWQLAEAADLIKINDDEAAWLLEMDTEAIDLQRAARAVAARADCRKVCITGGAIGAGLLVADEWYWVDATPTRVRDTIGAGDSFLAALVHGMLTSPEHPERALQAAAQLAAFVAGSDGATPDYSCGPDGKLADLGLWPK